MIRKGLTATGLCFLVAALAGAWGWMQTPPGVQIPVHFDAMGRADAWGPQWLGFGIMPASILFIGALMAALPGLDPRGENLRRSPHLYLAAWIGVSILLTLAHLHIVWTAVRGSAEADIRPVLAGLGVLFAVTGNYLGKARPNFFAGIRTPWTLSSDIAWERTHRFAGRLFVGAGLAIVVWSFAAPLAWALPGFLVLILGAALIPAVYSYFAWRDAPDRRT